jgi:catechol 2,3-dioxygenase
VAIAYPTRRALADAYRRLRDVSWPIRQHTDHGTHEAIYVIDPDGNTLELMWDRPPEQWPRDAEGHIAAEFGPDLDLDDLLRELD